MLLIDLDPQGNATTGCGIDKSAIERGTCEVLLGECTAAEAVLTSTVASDASAGRDADQSGPDGGRSAHADDGSGREQRLRDALEPIRADYDLMLIDCPPALNMLTVNALVAADSVLIPMQCEYYALEGLSALVATIEQIRGTANRELEIEGILRTMYDPRNNLAGEVSAQLMHAFRRQGVSHRRCRAISDWPRRRALASRRSRMTRTRAARWPTWHWPARCCGVKRSCAMRL